MKKEKIILFHPKPSATGSPIVLPQALLAISRFVPQDKYDIRIINSYLEKDFVKIIYEEAKDALLMGITAITGYQIKEGLLGAEVAKKRRADLPIIWGGYHPSLLPEKTIQDPLVDMVVRGQGERTFVEVLNALDNGGNLSEIKGLTFKKDGNVISNPDRPFEDINKFPPYPYNLINIEKCIRPTKFGLRTVDLTTSQGCPFRCRFCSEQVVYSRKWSGFDAERVVANMEFLVRGYGVDSFQITDANFFADKKRVAGICEGILKKGLKIQWGGANGRAPQLINYGEEMWQLIKRSGCKEILIGAESSLQEILDLLSKDAVVEDTIKLTEICTRHDISIVFSMMIGLPLDGISIDDEFKKNIEFVDRILQKSRKHQILLFLYTPYPGTELLEASVNKGFKPPEELRQWANFELNIRNTPWVDKKFSSLVEFLNLFILRFINEDMKESFMRRGGLKSLAFSIANGIAELRWKKKFFGMPLEYIIFQTYLNMRRLFTGK